MSRKTTLLLLPTVLLIGLIAYFSLSENAIVTPDTPAATRMKSSSQTIPELTGMFGDNASPAKSPIQKDFRLNNAQLKRHIEMRGRSVESLLAASRSSRNLEFLREAYERYPNNPEVLLELAMRSESPEERLEAIEALRKIEPDMGLPAYLLALEQFKAGDKESAMQSLLEARSTKFLDYSSIQQWEDLEQIYLDNGFTPLEAKFIGLQATPHPSLIPLLKLSKEMIALQADYLKKGDNASALQLAEAARSLNQKKQEEAFSILEIITGNAIEISLLKNLPPSTDLGSGLTAGQLLADLRTRNEQIQNESSLENFRGMNERDFIKYLESAKICGELEAIRQWNAKSR